MHTRRTLVATSGIAVLILTSLAMTPAVAHEQSPNKGQAKTVTLTAQLAPLNGSGATGTALAVVRNQKILHVETHAARLTPDAPHAQHIHFGAQARHGCPNLLTDDSNHDGRLNTVEGTPAYGPIAVSLTTTGDTSPASSLAVSRFPLAIGGVLNYSRDNIDFTDVAGTGYSGSTGTAKEIADAIRDGKGVVVIHGIDYDGNGKYSFSQPQGASELDPSLPAEATDPVSCGVLKK